MTQYAELRQKATQHTDKSPLKRLQLPMFPCCLWECPWPILLLFDLYEQYCFQVHEESTFWCGAFYLSGSFDFLARHLWLSLILCLRSGPLVRSGGSNDCFHPFFPSNMIFSIHFLLFFHSQKHRYQSIRIFGR